MCSLDDGRRGMGKNPGDPNGWKPFWNSKVGRVG